jgi:hypothetical protein
LQLLLSCQLQQHQPVKCRPTWQQQRSRSCLQDLATTHVESIYGDITLQLSGARSAWLNTTRTRQHGASMLAKLRTSLGLFLKDTVKTLDCMRMSNGVAFAAGNSRVVQGY